MISAEKDVRVETGAGLTDDDYMIRDTLHIGYMRILLPAVSTFVLFTIVIFQFLIPFFQQHLEDDRRNSTRELTTLAWNTIAHYHELEQSGRLTRAEAQTAALAQTEAMRYGPEKKDYFWINDLQPVLLMHPYRKDLVGTDVSGLADSSGIHPFVEFVRIVRDEGEGYVDYSWQWKDDSSHMASKVSFVRGFAPWGWIVGTGLYVDDVRTEISELSGDLRTASLGILAIVLLLLVYNARHGLRTEAQRRRAVSDLRDSEKKSRTLVESMNEGLAVVDLDRRLNYVNRCFCRMLQRSEDELLGHYIHEFMDETSARQCDSLVDRLKDDRAESCEMTWLRPDGQAVHAIVSPRAIVDDRDTVAGAFAVITDVTVLKSVQEELRRSKDRFKELADLLPQAVFETDRDGIFTYCNRHGFDFTGYTLEDMKAGVHFSQLLSSEESDIAAQNLMDGLEHGRPVQDEYKLVKRDGSSADVIVYATAIEQNGATVGLRGIAVDITEMKRLQQFAERAQRLETAGRIAGQVAHDFNNLLGPLVAYPDLMRSELPVGHPIGKYLGDMEQAAVQMSEINQQLLTLGRRGHYDLKPVALNDVVSQVIEYMAPLPDTMIVHTDLESDLRNINAGRSQIFRAVGNLVTNARDAMSDQGTLTLKSENVLFGNGHAAPGGLPAGDYVKLTVSDTGDGIPEDVQPSIFDAFFTTRTADKKRGSGLGLSIVHSVVEDHNGHIEYETECGQGTSFYLYFPVAENTIDRTAADGLAGGNERILVVDDDQLQREVARKLLEKLGYTVKVVDRGDLAIDELKRGSFDLLVLDMILADGSDGADLLARALEINRTQKAILVSGYAETERVQLALRLGAGAFVKKPLSLKSLARAVREELDRTTRPVAFR